MGELPRMLTRLGADTLKHHADADGDLERFLLQETVTLDDYRTYLTRVYRVLLPLEAALAATPGLADVLDVDARAKSKLLVQDLGNLGMTRQNIAAIPSCTAIPAFRNAAVALGWLYVIERPILASPVISRHLATQLPNEMVQASAYLSCHAGQTGSMWRALGTAMDRVATSTAASDQIVTAAHDAFRTLQRWRTHHLQQAGGIRRTG